MDSNRILKFVLIPIDGNMAMVLKFEKKKNNITYGYP